MSSQSGVTALVPCFNEGKTIAGVLKVLTRSKYIGETVVVNDGSTDNSQIVINNFEIVKVINLKKNIGKGGALKVGLERVTNPYVFLCDADLSGLSEHEIKKIIIPAKSGQCDVCIGIVDKGGLLGRYFRKNILPTISGQRVLKTDTLMEVLSSTYSQKWGVELYMNYYIRKKNLRAKKIILYGVTDPLHFTKRGFMSYLNRLLTFIKIYLNIVSLQIGLSKEAE